MGHSSGSPDRLPGRLVPALAPKLNLKRHLWHRAARRWPAIAARANSLAPRRASLGLAGLRLGNLFRLWRHRPIEIFEAELVRARLILADDDTNMPAGLALAEQHFIGERLLDRLLNETGHRAGAHLLIIAMLDEPLAGIFRKLDGDIAVAELRL